MVGFLEEVFRRFGGASASWADVDDKGHPCGVAVTQTVEHVVDETYGRLRAVPGYSRRLRGPVAATFSYVDQLADGMPGAMLCCRSAFMEDPRVNAFFVNPQHLQEVFSENVEVRELFDRHPDAEECWALLWMKREERKQLGMSLVGEAVQRDVMQTAVSFTDHQVVSPGRSEEEARRSLKCRIFNGLLAYIRNRASSVKTTASELEHRLKALRGRLKRSAEAEDVEESRLTLQAQIKDLESQLVHQDLRLASLEDHLDFVVDVLENPAQYLSSCSCSIRLSRMGIKLEGDSPDAGYEVSLSEVRFAAKEPRVGALVRFPRSELLPRQDFLVKADFFLAL